LLLFVVAVAAVCCLLLFAVAVAVAAAAVATCVTYAVDMPATYAVPTMTMAYTHTTISSTIPLLTPLQATPSAQFFPSKQLPF